MSWASMAALPQSSSVCSSAPRCPVTSRAPRDLPLFPSNLKLASSRLEIFRKINLRCCSNGDSGENVSRTTIDAFFLGKAVGEALNERIESGVGEFLSIVGRFQAEQQKQLLEFQEEVMEKARRAKEQASREAMDAQGLVSRSNIVDDTSTAEHNTSTASKPTNEDPFFGLLDKE